MSVEYNRQGHPWPLPLHWEDTAAAHSDGASAKPTKEEKTLFIIGYYKIMDNYDISSIADDVKYYQINKIKGKLIRCRRISYSRQIRLFGELCRDVKHCPHHVIAALLSSFLLWTLKQLK